MTKKKKHKKNPEVAALARKQKPKLGAPAITRKLDLACGQTPLDGFEGVDIYDGAPIVCDLMGYGSGRPPRAA